MIKIGIIGCGHWGPNFVRTFNKLKDTTVKYVCDLDSKRLREIKKRFSSVFTSTSFRDILKDSEIDAVVIATPAVTHYQLAKEALKFGKNVLIEKPFVLNPQEANYLIRLAKRVNKIIMPGHIFEYHDGVRIIRNYTREGKLGKIYYMYSRRTNLGPIRNDVNAIWDLALHDISIFNFILDAVPLKISADGFSYLRSHIEDVGFITLYYPQDIIAHIHVSWLDPRKIREIVMVGDKKMLMFDDLDGNFPLKFYDKRVMKKKYERPYYTFEEFKMIIKDGQVSTPLIKIREPLLVECESFLEYIKKGRVPEEVLKRGIDVVKILKGIESSLKNKGKEINLSIR
ncbi:MAG: gfo/Idh/MocA family oxidoreductase [Candidatus Omnitrophota bacterium]|nr:MAG: gfo/Idh/MocA family oxidoreductase [Candidatus Omnitrophota bacterium]RKY37836.1 MAG: gfo/Idh/MocA family oxidoreductase [Candidatus Omnitrophota bacterium]